MSKSYSFFFISIPIIYIIYIKLILKVILNSVHIYEQYMLFIVSYMTTKDRVLITLSPYLKEKLEQKAEEYGCSQAEVMRTAFIRMMEAER